MNTIIFNSGILQIERYRIRVSRFIMRIKTSTLSVIGKSDNASVSGDQSNPTAKTTIQSIELSCKLPAGREVIGAVLSGGEFAVAFKPDDDDYWEYAKDADGTFQGVLHTFDAKGTAFNFHKVRFGGQGNWLRGEVARDDSVKVSASVETLNRAERRRRGNKKKVRLAR